MSNSKSFEDLFIKPDDESYEWYEQFYNLAENGEYEKLEEHLNSAKELYLDEEQIYKAIFTFTLSTVTEEKKIRLLGQLKNIEWIQSVEASDTEIKITTNTGIIKVRTLTDVFPSLQEDPYIQTYERLGRCHEASLAISEGLGDIQNYIVTGYVFALSDKSKYVHSWIELVVNGEEVVIDYTLNAIMNKEGYYKIRHVKDISKISSCDVKNDKAILNKIGNFDLKEYLIFRDEIMRDLEKNIEMFNGESR